MSTIWRLKKGHDRRFRSGHPWVYSNELQDSPKGIEPGELIQLCTPGGEFLARGYGNPGSLIAFRTLSRNPKDENPLSTSSVLTSLKQSWSLRTRLGIDQVSHRLCFGEADHLPGLIIDAYVPRQFPKARLFVLQPQTAGIEKALSSIIEALELLAQEYQVDWKESAILIRGDGGYRKQEGLTEYEPKLHKSPTSWDLSDLDFLVASPLAKAAPVTLRAHFLKGQKTGFFLDQAWNIAQAASFFGNAFQKPEIKILDLCSYVGQWGVLLGQSLQNRTGSKVHVTAVDSSKPALELARHNLKQAGLSSIEALPLDVMKDLGQLSDGLFDLVISDPPAFIQSRKDIPQGTKAYLKLHTEMFRLVSPTGGVVACSCSSLLPEADFVGTLYKAANRNFKRATWVGRGAQSPDHPILAEFPEGQYLKARFGFVSNSHDQSGGE